MRSYYPLLVIALLLFISACSSGSSNPVLPESGADSLSQDNGAINGEASDVLLVSNSTDTLAYKAFGIYQVTIDPVALTGEIIPARNASAIGATFDADLTQFLTVTPCPNCLQINGIQLTADGHVNVGFAVKHPFADPAKRPDLHGFDVRGIVLAKGNFNFPNTLVNLTDTDTVAARANISLLVNPDGFTHHFDELASDVHYFNPPRSYDATINPYKRYFEDSATGAFDFANPTGHNVIPCGSDWETQVYTFDLQPGAETLDFGFIVDCAYGASAVLKNRFNPYYFLPEFNRKEAWKVITTIETNNLQSGSTSSTASLKISVCDWQAGLATDSNYPDTANLSGIKEKSDVASVSVEVPSVASLTNVTSPASGTGTGGDPYIYDLTVTNTLGASSGTYYGIVAVRDDLQGQTGPIGIPESPAGFPYAGPEIYDYSTYSIFSIRVNGTPPDVVTINTPTGVYENDLIHLNATVNEVDGDAVTYLWEQISPASPVGIFIDPTVKNAMYVVPALDDVIPSGIAFTLKLTASDADGEDSKTMTFTALEDNHAPVCMGIDTDPFTGVIGKSQTMDLFANGFDADGDGLNYEWDMNYDGSFSEDESGPEIIDYSWADQGFYHVACMVTEDRTNALSDMCVRSVVQEGITNNAIQVDDAALSPLPNYCFPDVVMSDSLAGPSCFNVVYQDQNNDEVWYCNNVDDPNDFSNHIKLADQLPTGWTSYSKIAQNDSVLLGVWMETQPSTSYLIKTRTSLDDGDNWSAEVVAASIIDPDYVSGLEVCEGDAPGEFYIFFTKRVTGVYKCYMVRTSNNGASWSYPGAPSNGQFRDATTLNIVYDPMISVDGNGVIHAVWMDADSNYHYYDYSTDNGDTWHTDIQVTGASSSSSMEVDDDGNVHMTYLAANVIYYVRINYGSPPVVGLPSVIFEGLINSNDTCFAVSPDASVMIATWAFSELSNYVMVYFYSFDHGLTWDYYFNDHNLTQISWPACDGTGWEGDPGCSMIFNVWIDNRTSSWPEGHIYGEYLYLADRF
jgi:hypothetical protein